MIAPPLAAPDPRRRTALRETVIAALSLSAAAHAGAVYWAVTTGGQREEAMSAGGTIAVEVLLVQGPSEQAAAPAPGAEAAGGAQAPAETGPIADHAVAEDSTAGTPFTQPEPAPRSAVQHEPEPSEAAPPEDASSAAAAPPPPKPSLAGTPAASPAQVTRSEAAMSLAHAATDADETPIARPGTAGEPALSDGAEGAQAAAPLAGNPAPDYPYAARLRGQHGSVLLRVEVAASGDAGNVRIERSSGYESLDRAAALAVRRWRFRPAQRNGAPVATTVQVPVRFDLQ